MSGWMEPGLSGDGRLMRLFETSDLSALTARLDSLDTFAATFEKIQLLQRFQPVYGLREVKRPEFARSCQAPRLVARPEAAKSKQRERVSTAQVKPGSP